MLPFLYVQVYFLQNILKEWNLNRNNVIIQGANEEKCLVVLFLKKKKKKKKKRCGGNSDFFSRKFDIWYTSSSLWICLGITAKCKVSETWIFNMVIDLSLFEVIRWQNIPFLAKQNERDTLVWRTKNVFWLYK